MTAQSIVYRIDPEEGDSYMVVMGLAPNTSLTIQQIAAKHVPHNHRYLVMDNTDIPEDKTGWVLTNNELGSMGGLDFEKPVDKIVVVELYNGQKVRAPNPDHPENQHIREEERAAIKALLEAT